MIKQCDSHKKNRLKTHYSRKNISNPAYTKIWFYKPWESQPREIEDKIDLRCCYNLDGISFHQMRFIREKAIDNDTRDITAGLYFETKKEEKCIF
ncbi:MAG: hypothetical protein J1F17_01700 [Oscillospiraceae bacterium]|nr:hypothetical protein [Oscillospiraceae bacterium]